MNSIDAGTIRIRTLQAIRNGLVGTLIPDLSPGDPLTVGHLTLRLVDHLISLDAVGNADDQWNEAEAMARIVEDTADAHEFIAAFSKGQTAALIRRDPTAAGGIADLYLGGRSNNAEDEKERQEPELLTAGRLTDYLARRFPDAPPIVIRSLRLLPGGMSKQTFKVDAERDGQDYPFVIRKDFAISASTAGVTDEYPMLTAMWQAGGLPMAEPLWIEADPAVFGTPMIAVSLVEGSNDYSAAISDPDAALTFADALAGAMAQLHRMPLQHTTAGPLVQRNRREHVAAEIARWHGRLQASKIAPEPALEAVFSWLSANIPDSPAPAALVHGDIGFHNMLMKDGRLTALLDWEFSHIGDPAEDVIYARFFVEQVIAWPRFLDLYEKHGGIRPTAEQEHFYAVWQSARNAAGCAGAEKAFLSHPGADMKLGVSGMTFKPRFAIDALQRIAARPTIGSRHLSRSA